ncbi:MAG: ribosome silencing factor [Clostridia bacterium]|nr:ribosome silencing factor [Clostridia bacterium]
MESKELMERIVKVLDSHKAANICAIQIKEVSSLADYFVVAGGNSSTQVKALTDYVDVALSEEGVTPLRTEGYGSANWILMDYGAVILHVFQPQARQYYDLERLWKDGTPVDLSGIIESEAQL